MATPQPAPPSPILPEPTWEHIELYEHVKEAISSLPGHFTTETYIEGILATDIFTLNAALSATIEEQVVATLNKMRNIWDPNDQYSLYRFVRQAQTFPDVLLRRNPQERVRTSEEHEKRKAEQAFDKVFLCPRLLSRFLPGQTLHVLASLTRQCQEMSFSRGDLDGFQQALRGDQGSEIAVDFSSLWRSVRSAAPVDLCRRR